MANARGARVTGDLAAESGGTYSLLVELADGIDVEIGALGVVELPAGWYAYTGSALGPGGFARVRRHRAVAAGERETRHWHLDYLLGQPAASLDLVVGNAGVDAECRIARGSTAVRSRLSAHRTVRVPRTWRSHHGERNF